MRKTACLVCLSAMILLASCAKNSEEIPSPSQQVVIDNKPPTSSQRLITVERIIIGLVAERYGVEQSDIKRETNLYDDLGGDWLDFVELIMAVEDFFGIEITDEASERIKTVGQLVDYVIAHLP